MPDITRLILFLFCLTALAESRKPKRRRWTGQLEMAKPSHLYKKNLDVTKIRKGKPQPLLRVEDHDFSMRPAFGERETASERGTQAGEVGEEEAGFQRRSLMWGSIP